MKEIADLANVTTGTVSRAINNEPGVSEKERQRILAIAEQLNYTRKPSSSRAAEKSKSIGVIWKQPDGIVFNHLIDELEQQAELRGYTVLTTVAEPEKGFRVLHEHGVEHILLWIEATEEQWTPSLEFMQTKEQFRGNMLTIRRGSYELPLGLKINREGAIFRAVKHLAKLGHSRVVFIGQHAEHIKGFTLGLLELQLEYRSEYIIQSDRHYPVHLFPEDQLLDLVKQPKETRPTAFVIDHYVNFFRFFHTILKHGFSIPDDFSVIVYDTIPILEKRLSSLISTPITTVGSNVQIISKRILDILLKERKDASDAELAKPLLMEAEIFDRGSTAPIA
jgi:LacI family transcriptional regulator